MQNSLRLGLLCVGTVLTFLTFLTFLALSAFPGFSMAAASANPCVLEAGTATYNFLVNGTSVGDVTRKLSSDHAGAYQASSVTNAHFLFFKDQVTESSAGLITKNQISPVSYQIVDTRVKQPVNISFDQAKKLAEISSNKNTISLNIPADIQDNLSYVLALRLGLIQGKVPNVLTVLEQDKKKRSVSMAFYFKNLGEFNLTTSLGNLKTIKLSRLDASTGLTYDYWFAPSLNDVLVKTDATQENMDSKDNKDNSEADQSIEIVAETDILTYVKASDNLNTGCVISA